MASQTIEVELRLPDEVSESTRETARKKAHESAVLVLLEAGNLSIGRAAEELHLTYHEMLELMAARAIPVERGPIDLAPLADAQRKLAADHP